MYFYDTEWEEKSSIRSPVKTAGGNFYKNIFLS